VEITRSEDGLLLKKLDVFFVEVLRQIPVSTDTSDCDDARDRLYSKPTKNARTNEEWIEFVQPELRHLFESANEIVRRDLEDFDEKDVDGLLEYSVLIPKKNFDSWLNSLNQARLALAARHDFSDQELASDEAPTFDTVRDLSLFQIHFYGFLQELLIQELQQE